MGELNEISSEEWKKLFSIHIVHLKLRNQKVVRLDKIVTELLKRE